MNESERTNPSQGIDQADGIDTYQKTLEAMSDDALEQEYAAFQRARSDGYMDSEYRFTHSSALMNEVLKREAKNPYREGSMGLRIYCGTLAGMDLETLRGEFASLQNSDIYMKASERLTKMFAVQKEMEKYHLSPKVCRETRKEIAHLLEDSAA